MLDNSCRGPPAAGSTTKLNTLLAGRRPQGYTAWPDGLAPGPRTVKSLSFNDQTKKWGVGVVQLSNQAEAGLNPQQGPAPSQPAPPPPNPSNTGFLHGVPIKVKWVEGVKYIREWDHDLMDFAFKPESPPTPPPHHHYAPSHSEQLSQHPRTVHEPRDTHTSRR